MKLQSAAWLTRLRMKTRPEDRGQEETSSPPAFLKITEHV